MHACACDLDNLALALPRTPDVVIGHSFGGKVALHYHMLAETAPAFTWVLDSHLATFDVSTILREVVMRLLHWPLCTPTSVYQCRIHAYV